MNSASISASALIKIAAQLTDGQLQTLSAQAPTGFLSETFLFPGADRRAGRARAIAEAQGTDVPLSVKLPRAANLLSTLGGAAAGSIAGGLIGGAADPRLGAGPGALVGSGLGALTAGIINTIYRRRKATQIFEGSKGKDLDVGKITVPSRLTSLTSGIHHQGRADVARALAGGTDKFPANNAMTAARALSMVPYLGLLAAPVAMGGSAVHTGSSREAIQNAQA